MRPVKFTQCSYPADVRRIALVAASLGYFLTPHEAEDLWDDHSESACAGWLSVTKSDEELKTILQILIEGEQTK